MPKISVLMPAYNAALYIEEAIQSILEQTFSDYEFLICNDGSTDNTLDLISSFSDSRIQILKNKTNKGLPFSRNKLVKHAKGKYLAWLDADDVAYPARLQEQFDFLEQHSEVYVLGTYAHFYNHQKKMIHDYISPVLMQEQVRAYLFFRNCLANSSVIMRRGIAYNYCEEMILAQDYELWNRILRKYPIAVLPNFLVKIRIHEDSTSRKQSERQKTCVKMIFKNQLEYYDLNIDKYLEPLYLLGSYEYMRLEGQEKKQALINIFNLLTEMYSWNKKYKHFNHSAYKYVVEIFSEELTLHLRYRQRVKIYFRYYPASKWKGYVLAIYTLFEAVSAFIHFTLLPKIKKKIIGKDLCKMS